MCHWSFTFCLYQDIERYIRHRKWKLVSSHGDNDEHRHDNHFNDDTSLSFLLLLLLVCEWDEGSCLIEIFVLPKRFVSVTSFGCLCLFFVMTETAKKKREARSFKRDFCLQKRRCLNTKILVVHPPSSCISKSWVLSFVLCHQLSLPFLYLSLEAISWCVWSFFLPASLFDSCFFFWSSSSFKSSSSSLTETETSSFKS